MRPNPFLLATNVCFKKNLDKPQHRGAFCQFPFRWIYFYGSNKSTGKYTGKMHLCGLVRQLQVCNNFHLTRSPWDWLPFHFYFDSVRPGILKYYVSSLRPLKFPSYASAKEIWSNQLLSTNHKTADQSKFNAVISIGCNKCRKSKFSSHLRTTVHWKAGRNLNVLCLKFKKKKIPET